MRLAIITWEKARFLLKNKVENYQTLNSPSASLALVLSPSLPLVLSLSYILFRPTPFFFFPNFENFCTLQIQNFQKMKIEELVATIMMASMRKTRRLYISDLCKKN